MATVLETLEKLSDEIIQGEVRYRESDHSYFHIPTKKKLVSVSRVIKTVFNKKSYEDAPPEVVDNARIRGIAVDRYMDQYIRESTIQISAGESRDVADRVLIAHRIWEEEFPGLKAVSQKMVYSAKDGIAGTMDFWINESIVADLKCTYNPEKDWILQLGAYATYAPNTPKRIGIIHVSPKLYKEEGGGVWMEYDLNGCMAYWAMALKWWNDTLEMVRDKEAVKVPCKKDRS